MPGPLRSMRNYEAARVVRATIASSCWVTARVLPRDMRSRTCLRSRFDSLLGRESCAATVATNSATMRPFHRT